MCNTESWERQKGESSLAFGAFQVYRDCGPERNIKKALWKVAQDEAVVKRKYTTWCYWATRYDWIKRAGDYDDHLDKLSLAERREAIKEWEKNCLRTSRKMLTAVDNKLDTMGKDELKQAYISDVYKTAVETGGKVLGRGKEEGGKEQWQNRTIEVRFDAGFKELINDEE